MTTAARTSLPVIANGPQLGEHALPDSLRTLLFWRKRR
jgi:hypothetical protein